MPYLRIVIAIGIGLLYGTLGHTYRASRTGYSQIGDFYWALYTAQELLQGRDPYDFISDAAGYFIPYPLPVGLIGLPFLWLAWPLASTLFSTLSISLLAYLMTQDGKWWRLLLFASLPMYVSAMYSQWSALILCAWFVPLLAPSLLLIKPHIALPLALQRLTWKGLMLAGAIAIASLLIYPQWPIRFLSKLDNFQQIIALFTLPFGPLLVLSLLLWRNERARLFFLMSILPFRSIYDLCALLLIPQTPRQMVYLTLFSWLPMFSVEGSGAGHASVIPLFFLPTLVVLFLQDPEWKKRIAQQKFMNLLRPAIAKVAPLKRKEKQE